MATHERDAAAVEIDITIQNNTLIVGENGGHVLGKPGDRILWRSSPDTKFTLEFFRLAVEPAAKGPQVRTDVAKLNRWPFTEPKPPGGIVGPADIFEGTLAACEKPPHAFKYTVTVQNLQLDPIVIVDR